MKHIPKSKHEKIETAKRLIRLQQRVSEHDKDISNLNTKIEIVRQEGIDERRRLENKLKRSIWEAFEIAMGNRKKVEEVSHRVEDTSDRLDKVEQTMDWIMKTLIGLFITAVFGGIIAYLFNIF